ncbi:IS1380 family transposase [Halorhodospira halochloris]|uniref:IS1380 family transposase n=1 Tax=Halorhodospira halochloris TaxID=1052 RepID=UPI001EE80007|nr:IS1380 family transposase [Halorhodospira halochloris]MCG5549597.1 IS1380 family transposase [Halorhodospira halochloris]
MDPVNFRIERTQRVLTGQAGLALVGRALKRFARVEQHIDPKFPVRGAALPNSDILTSYLGLLCQGKSDFEAIESYRSEPFFAASLGLRSVPSCSRLRQRLNEFAAEDGALEAIDEFNVDLLARSRAPIEALDTGHVALDIDVFTMDNSNTRKEGVSRTYAGFDGYSPIAAYLGEQGWCVGLELREGSVHSAAETDYVLERALPRAARLTDEPLLVRMDSGFDSAALYSFMNAFSEKRQATGVAPVEYLVKWNPRKEGVGALIEAALADEDRIWCILRKGKRMALLDECITRRTRDGQNIELRRVSRVVERTIEPGGQYLLMPDYEVEVFLATLDAADVPAWQVVRLYEGHGIHEQFHSEIKTDLDLERLPSRRFRTNDAVLTLAAVAYNLLRLIGQNALLAEDAPVRHRAKRRRLRTVIQEMITVAAMLVSHARQKVLSFGYHCPAYAYFERLYREWSVPG